VVLILVRRPGAIAIAPYAVAVAFAATALPLLVRADGAQLIGSAFGSAIMTAGLLLSFYAKLSLNRSFGLVAANRGLKSRGAYRIVRHPMYLGYAVTHLGFLLTQFSRWNLLVYVAAWTFQILRMHEEERFLYQDDDYRTYTKKVVSRLIPGVY
jgi:protein-S-isoprenylcysteine O-methyltransferase Ste14